MLEEKQFSLEALKWQQEKDEANLRAASESTSDNLDGTNPETSLGQEKSYMYEKVIQRMVSNGWDEADIRAKMDIMYPHSGYLEITEDQDKLITQAFDLLSQYDLSKWKIPNGDIPNHMLRAEVNLTWQDILDKVADQAAFSDLEISDMKVDVEVLTSGRGSFGDITGFSLKLSSDKEEVTLTLDGIGVKVKRKDEADETSSSLDFFKRNPQTATELIVAVSETASAVLNNR